MKAEADCSITTAPHTHTTHINKANHSKSSLIILTFDLINCLELSETNANWIHANRTASATSNNKNIGSCFERILCLIQSKK